MTFPAGKQGWLDKWNEQKRTMLQQFPESRYIKDIYCQLLAWHDQWQGENERSKVKYLDLVLFIYLGFYVAFNTVQVISRRVVGRAEETNTYSWSRFCTVNCGPMANNYQLSHLRPGREPNPGLSGGRRECCHSATVAPRFLRIYVIHIRVEVCIV